MYLNRAPDGTNNLSGQKIAQLRKQMYPKTSQRMLAEQLENVGIQMDKRAIQRIESGQRFITDIELAALAKFFQIPSQELLAGPCLPVNHAK